MRLEDFDEYWDGDSPQKLPEFLSFLNGLMWADDTITMNEVFSKLNIKTSKLMMVSVLRGLYAYRRLNPLPMWDVSVIKVRDWLDSRGDDADSLLAGIIDRDSRNPVDKKTYNRGYK